MAVSLIRHAIFILINNLSSALKASVVPLLIGVAIVGGVNLALGLPLLGAEMPMMADDAFDADAMMMSAGAAGAALLSSLVFLVVAILVFSWIAVTWHRFILLEEYPDIVPSYADKPVGAYVWASIKLALLMIIIAIPVMLVAGMPLAGLAAASPLLGVIVGTVVLGGIFGFLWLRVALILPATAIGETMTIGESWGTTAKVSGAIFGVAILLMVVNAVIGLPGLLAGPNLVGAILNLISQWITAMLGICILTTLYGHLVQGRALPQ